jgi:tripartite-type tricarboxylate transporter receptor subunit TctC
MSNVSLKRSCAIAVTVGLASLSTLATSARAQVGAAWPSQNIMLVVPYPAGGPTDIIARIVAPHMAEQLGKPIVIENRAGASSTLGTASVARAAPDGHTLLVADPSMTVAPNVIAKLSFDPARDFTAVIPLVRSVMMLVVDHKLPVRSVAEFVAMAKQKPGEIKYAHSGLGSPPHLGAMAFVEATGVDMLQVPYRGVGLALNDVVGGHISMVFVSQGVAAPHVTAGTARVLATMGGARLKSLPEVPTFRELGIDLKVIDEGTWFGIVAPAGTPPPIVERLNAVANRALADPAIRQRFEAIDYTVVGGTAEGFARTIDAHIAHWRTAFAKAGVKPQ